MCNFIFPNAKIKKRLFQAIPRPPLFFFFKLSSNKHAWQQRNVLDRDRRRRSLPASLHLDWAISSLRTFWTLVRSALHSRMADAARAAGVKSVGGAAQRWAILSNAVYPVPPCAAADGSRKPPASYLPRRGIWCIQPEHGRVGVLRPSANRRRRMNARVWAEETDFPLLVYPR